MISGRGSFLGGSIASVDNEVGVDPERDSMTLLLAWQKAASEADAAAVLDGLRERLGPVDGLVFLRRRQSTRQSAKRAAGLA
jgi:hypothetical protein